jgi:hypothetical protein
MRDRAANVTSIAVLVGALSSVLTGTAEAYIDPGAGSILLQVVLGGVAGLAVFARILWQRLQRRFRARRGLGTSSDPSRP